MIVKTEAIVLSAMKYRETSKIVRLYTREFGKLSVIAKGARDRKSKFRSALDPMNRVACVIYKNENRELQLLSQCDVVSAFRHLSEDMEKMRAAMAAIELIAVVTHDEEANDPLYALLVEMLETVNDATNDASVALYYFEMKLADILGFKPELYECSYCAKETSEETAKGFSVSGSGVVCSECSENSSAANKISAGTLKVLQRLQHAEKLESVLRIQLSRVTKAEVHDVLRRHLQNHIEGFRGLKSEEVFAAISSSV
jgi:DNA repair protein RecO (recombination protein O)